MRTFAAIFAASVSLVAQVAHAAPLNRGLGGRLDVGTNELVDDDDASTPPIDLGSEFPDGLNFYGTTFTMAYVNSNGHVTFDRPLSIFTPAPYPRFGFAMFALWWSDIDVTRNAASGLFWELGVGEFTVTWVEAGHWSRTPDDTLRNSFQLILTERGDFAPGDFDVEMRFERCEWTTAELSGGVDGFGGDPAVAGWNAANGLDSFLLPGSGTMAVLDLCTESNVGDPGVWRYEFRCGFPIELGVTASCNDNEGPPYVSGTGLLCSASPGALGAPGGAFLAPVLMIWWLRLRRRA